MSKIEKYQAAKRIAEKVKRDVTCALGEDSTRNDKHRVMVRFVGLEKAQWNDMKFTIHTSHGYYGSSSGYSDSSEELGKFLQRAIQEKAKELMKRTIELSEADAEKARLEALDEAKDVIEGCEA